MLAEASGCGAELDVAAVPRPAGATAGDWLTCFPGFAMVTATRRPAGAARRAGGLGPVRAAGRRGGVSLRWPDGVLTPALASHVTGLGKA